MRQSCLIHLSEAIPKPNNIGANSRIRKNGVQLGKKIEMRKNGVICSEVRLSLEGRVNAKDVDVVMSWKEREQSFFTLS